MTLFLDRRQLHRLDMMRSAFIPSLQLVSMPENRTECQMHQAHYRPLNNLIAITLKDILLSQCLLLHICEP
jgi:hypothetical protein